MKPLFDKPTIVSLCTQQDIETIVELGIKLGLPINPFTKRDYKTADHAYISWEIDGGGICRTNKSYSNTVTANQFVAQMYEWSAENNPKAEEWQPKRGDWVEASDDRKDWERVIFLAKIEGSDNPIITVLPEFEPEFESGDVFPHGAYNYMRRITQKPTSTQTKEARIAELVAELNQLINDANQ